MVQGHQTPTMVGVDEVLLIGIDSKGGADSS
jgi:hypothetical protein